MKRKIMSIALAFVMCLTLVPTAFAELRDDGYYYFTDRNGNEMKAPTEAFASKVVEFTPGDPWTSEVGWQKTENALGLPDDAGADRGDEITGILTLGAGGVLVLEFDIYIYDGEGDDVYIFEVGPDVEDTKVEVSNDLVTWYYVGDAAGKTAGVDLNGKVPEGSRFRYVRLTDLRAYPSSHWPGADIDAVSGLNTRAISSNWSEDEVDRAEELGLVPDVLVGADLTQPITRLEFAAVAVKTYEALSGVDAIPAVENPFIDCDDVEVLKAYNIGAVNGVSETEFAPDELLERQQAAAMLTRVYKRVTMPTWTLATDSSHKLTFDMPALFADDSDISGYARESVYFMAANGIIEGVGDNKFAPKNTSTVEEANRYANATREQALAIAVRMVENLK